MNSPKKKSENIEPLSKLEEPSVSYPVSNAKKETASKPAFDFDTEFENGFTLEEAKAESIKRIREWWGK
ncbi:MULTISPECIES: hypothetical protein [unclassified Flavobacterium]|jgi:hypothetical protein|uniref:hypothetical protein n=1 Tax=unclassified Flavobacterium TaxID=196869 RepID=UPI0025B9C707|nr:MULTISPECIES: hypothetical protein [unclassified Flavobacterium]